MSSYKSILSDNLIGKEIYQPDAPSNNEIRATGRER
jgi:hypothetical protein